MEDVLIMLHIHYNSNKLKKHGVLFEMNMLKKDILLL